MDLRGRKILITGADGFIGSHVTEALVSHGAGVRAFVQYNSLGLRGWLDHVPPQVLDNVEVIPGDIRDFNRVRAAALGCDVILHLAALVGIPYSYHSPESYVDTNIKGTLNVLLAARDLAVQKVVHTSTSEVYGSARYVPMDENHPLRGQSPYAASKIGADQMAMAFHDSFGTPVAIIRPFNTYGPRQSARAVIPAVIIQIASGRRIIKLGSLEPTRDFSYIKDTVRGFIAVAQADEAVGEVVNIGSNHEVSIGDLVATIADLMQREIRLETEGQRVRPPGSEVTRLWADNRKASVLLGFRPEYAGYEGLRRGLAETISWFIDPENLARYRPEVYSV